jgi:hypothetical protein
MSIVEIYDGEDFCVLEGGDEDGGWGWGRGRGLGYYCWQGSILG